MTNLILDSFSQYEQRMVDTKDGLAFQKIRLDEVVPCEERMLRIEAIADPIAKSPEQIYVEQETLRELYAGLDRIGRREQAYLLYRYGLAYDAIGAAIHFNLSEIRRNAYGFTNTCLYVVRKRLEAYHSRTSRPIASRWDCICS